VVQDRSDSVRLDSRTDQGRTVQDTDRSGLPALDKLFLRFRILSAAVGVAEDRGQHGHVCGVVEDGAEGDGGRFDGREVVDGVAAKFTLAESLKAGCWRVGMLTRTCWQWCLKGLKRRGGSLLYWW
jgi:hypothetical protein